jgi:hypothetical protein
VDITKLCQLEKSKERNGYRNAKLRIATPYIAATRPKKYPSVSIETKKIPKINTSERASPTPVTL